MKKISLNANTILIISCFFCILSQLPDLWGNFIISLTYSMGWIGLLILFLRKENYKIKIPKIIYFIPITFDLVLLLLQIMMGKNYISSNMFKPLNLCFFISIIGYYLGKYYDYSLVIKIIKCFIFASFMIGISIFNNTFRGIDWQNASGYLYVAKNSAAMIFLIAIIMVLIYLKDLKKVIAIPLLIFLLSLIIMLKSRATIVCLVFVILYIIIFYVKKPMLKIILIVIFISLTIFVFMNNSAYDFFINKIILNNRGSDNFTVITSGRDMHFNKFIKMFPKYFLFGTGGTYLESFPLASLLSYGFFGGLLLIVYAFLPMIYVLKDLKYNFIDKKLKHLILAINTVMMINGLFEELTPLGPGVKCFVMWLLFGIYIGNLRRESKVDTIEKN